MNEGSLVPDELIIDLVAHEINAVNGANYLLDGNYLDFIFNNNSNV